MGRCPIEIEEIVNKELIIMDKIGKGVYGNVYKCINLNNNKTSALKIHKNDHKFLNSISIELNILKKLNKIIKEEDLKQYIPLLYDNFYYKDHCCFNLELYDENLYTFMCNNYHTDEYNSEFILKLTYKIIKGMYFINDNNIIHCDLKPENILFNHSKNEIVICDFGLSEQTQKLNKEEYTSTIQSIWYRSPEIALKSKYNYKIDIWSIGTILYEIIYNKPLLKCKDVNELMYYTVKYIGVPSNDINCYNLDEFRKYFYINGNEITYKKFVYRKDLIDKNILNKKFSSEKILKSICTIILKTLVWDIDKRINYNEILDLLEYV